MCYLNICFVLCLWLCLHRYTFLVTISYSLSSDILECLGGHILKVSCNKKVGIVFIYIPIFIFNRKELTSPLSMCAMCLGGCGCVVGEGVRLRVGQHFHPTPTPSYTVIITYKECKHGYVLRDRT